MPPKKKGIAKPKKAARASRSTRKKATAASHDNDNNVPNTPAPIRVNTDPSNRQRTRARVAAAKGTKEISPVLPVELGADPDAFAKRVADGEISMHAEGKGDVGGEAAVDSEDVAAPETAAAGPEQGGHEVFGQSGAQQPKIGTGEDHRGSSSSRQDHAVLTSDESADPPTAPKDFLGGPASVGHASVAGSKRQRSSANAEEGPEDTGKRQRADEEEAALDRLLESTHDDAVKEFGPLAAADEALPQVTEASSASALGVGTDFERRPSNKVTIDGSDSDDDETKSLFDESDGGKEVPVESQPAASTPKSIISPPIVSVTAHPNTPTSNVGSPTAAGTPLMRRGLALPPRTPTQQTPPTSTPAAPQAPAASSRQASPTTSGPPVTPQTPGQSSKNALRQSSPMPDPPAGRRFIPSAGSQRIAPPTCSVEELSDPFLGPLPPTNPGSLSKAIDYTTRGSPGFAQRVERTRSPRITIDSSARNSKIETLPDVDAAAKSEPETLPDMQTSNNNEANMQHLAKDQEVDRSPEGSLTDQEKIWQEELWAADIHDDEIFAQMEARAAAEPGNGPVIIDILTGKRVGQRANNNEANMPQLAKDQEVYRSPERSLTDQEKIWQEEIWAADIHDDEIFAQMEARAAAEPGNGPVIIDVLTGRRVGQRDHEEPQEPAPRSLVELLAGKGSEVDDEVREYDDGGDGKVDDEEEEEEDVVDDGDDSFI